MDVTFLLTIILGFGVLMLCFMGLMFWRDIAERRLTQADQLRGKQLIEQELAELKGRISSIGDLSLNRQSEFTTALNERLDQVTDRLGANLSQSHQVTARQLSELQQRLAVIDNAQKNITDLSGQMVTLRDILANKQARGAFGQIRMEAILEDALPSSMFTTQATLSNNRRPDALIHLPGDTPDFVIDAKFPLEGFELLREAQNDQMRKQAAAQVKTDISRHINEIAERYFIVGETQDTALMFVPAESVYAELHENFPELIQKSYRARVVITSPNMLMLAVQTMFAILKDAQMREQASLIQREVSLLMDDVNRLGDRVIAMQKHHALMGKDLEQVLTSSNKISTRAQKIDTLDLGDDEPVGVDKKAS